MVRPPRPPRRTLRPNCRESHPEHATCAICLGDLAPKHRKLACGHCFDAACISEWITAANKGNERCPLCKEEVEMPITIIRL